MSYVWLSLCLQCVYVYDTRRDVYSMIFQIVVTKLNGRFKRRRRTKEENINYTID